MGTVGGVWWETVEWSTVAHYLLVLVQCFNRVINTWRRQVFHDGGSAQLQGRHTSMWHGHNGQDRETGGQNMAAVSLQAWWMATTSTCCMLRNCKDMHLFWTHGNDNDMTPDRVTHAVTSKQPTTSASQEILLNRSTGTRSFLCMKWCLSRITCIHYETAIL